MNKIRKDTMRQYFEQYSNLVQASEDINVKILTPFEIEACRMLHDRRSNNSFEICVSFKQPKRFMDAFNLSSLDEMKTITPEDMMRVWKYKFLERIIYKMQNELCRIGQLIYDLRQKTYFTQGQENFDFLDQEFARITLALGVEWDKKVKGLQYLLEFHKEEAVRLSNLVDDLIIELAMRSKSFEFLDKVYQTLNNHFIELLRRIDLMIANNTSYNLN